MVEAMNYKYVLVYSFEDFIVQIESYFDNA